MLHWNLIKRGHTVKLLKRIALTILILLVLAAPALSLAESDYETGDGWVYQDGMLKIVTNNGLINFLYHEFDMRGDLQHKHTAADVDRVVIGKDVTDIIVDEFIGDYNPSTTSVEEENDTFIIDNGWVVNKQTNTLFGAANVKQNKTQVVIDDLPVYIEHIGMYAFSYCGALRKISIPDRVISIGDSAFIECYSLESINLPSSTTSIGVGAFLHCTNLTQINLGAAINNIGTAAFALCINLVTPSIHLTKIEVVHGNSFASCDQFQTVDIPSSVYQVDDLSFSRCNNLCTLIFHSDHLIIMNSAFSGCENIGKLIFTKGKPTYIGQWLFGETEKTSDGKGFIVHYYEESDKIIPYPTLYYTAAYADEWAPNGETEWNGYQIQQISQEELDAVLAEARGEPVPTVTASLAPTFAATTAPGATAISQETNNTDQESSSSSEILLLSAILAVTVGIVVMLMVRKRKAEKIGC